ncbi:MAG: thioredoxin domain-containing protein [Candidatus Magasanikbacteria bacterium]|jgi:protein-disulfide isomerase
MPTNQPVGKIRWYETWPGLTIAGLVATVIIGAIIFAVIVGRYYWLIRHGAGAELYAKFHAEDIAKIDPALAALRTRLETTVSPYLGKNGAPVTIVQFMDFKCPYSKQAVAIMYQLVNKYPDKVKIIFRHFPLESLYLGTSKLSEVSYCAFRQGAFWQMFNAIYDKQSEWSEMITDAEITALADTAGVDKNLLNECLKDPATGVAVRADFAAGVREGVKATPTFFVNGVRAAGVIPFSIWEGFLKK